MDPSKYPPVRRDGTEERIHGLTITDEYRWLEDPDSEETKDCEYAEWLDMSLKARHLVQLYVCCCICETGTVCELALLHTHLHFIITVDAAGLHLYSPSK